MTEQFFTTEDGVRRPATELEIENILAARARKLQAESDKAAMAEAKEAAQAKLTALGLTADDLKALGL